MAHVNVDRHALVLNPNAPTTAVELQGDPARGVVLFVVLHDGVRVVVAMRTDEARAFGAGMIVAASDVERASALAAAPAGPAVIVPPDATH